MLILFGDKIRSQTKPFLYLFQLVAAKDPVHVLMLAKLSVLDHKISFLKARQLEIDDIDEQFSRLCESILLDCEQANQLPIDESIEHANQVLASGGVIHSTLYQKFLDKYPPKL